MRGCTCEQYPFLYLGQEGVSVTRKYIEDSSKKEEKRK